MASGSFLQVDVKCPYYQSDNGRDRIICEGIIPGTNTQSFYYMGLEFKKHMQIFCTDRYWNCEICQALDQKYEEE